MNDERVWRTSMRLTFRLLPTPSDHLRVFLESDGLRKDEVLAKLPYAAARAGDGGTGAPDEKRYRDARQLFRSAGLLYEHEERVHVTPLGKATLWWLDKVNERNLPVLGRYASYALSAWQLRNPTKDGSHYAQDVKVFPYSFIWRVMLQTDGKLSSDECSRAVLRLTNESQVDAAAQAIREARRAGDPTILGEPVQTDNDRLIPWFSLASFGWTLIREKRAGDNASFYEIPPSTWRIVERAAALRRPHLPFDEQLPYFRHIERAAALPPDLR